eukprot:jgi/Botrbrau1/2909/Bobra.0036s0047.3
MLSLKQASGQLFPSGVAPVRSRFRLPCSSNPRQPYRKAAVALAKPLGQIMRSRSRSSGLAQAGRNLTQKAATGVDAEEKVTIWPLVPYLLATIGLAAAFAWVGIEINQYSDAQCSLLSGSTKPCTDIPYFMKLPLIATHLLMFGIGPISMYTFYTRAPLLESWKSRSPFYALTGIAFLMTSIASEIGWHVTTQWFYQEEYMIMNYAFYFFLTLGTALWAVGIEVDDDGDGKYSDKVNTALLLCPALVAGLYYLGAAVIHTKVPIYILLSFQYAILTYRFWKLLDKDPKVFLFPFFTVGVNLFFIFLLNKYQTDIILNPLFHILHDAGGTEAGVVIITFLTWLAPNKQALKK